MDFVELVASRPPGAASVLASASSPGSIVSSDGVLSPARASSWHQMTSRDPPLVCLLHVGSSSTRTRIIGLTSSPTIEDSPGLSFPSSVTIETSRDETHFRTLTHATLYRPQGRKQHGTDDLESSGLKGRSPKSSNKCCEFPIGTDEAFLRLSFSGTQKQGSCRQAIGQIYIAGRGSMTRKAGSEEGSKDPSQSPDRTEILSPGLSLAPDESHRRAGELLALVSKSGCGSDKETDSEQRNEEVQGHDKESVKKKKRKKKRRHRIDTENNEVSHNSIQSLEPVMNLEENNSPVSGISVATETVVGVTETGTDAAIEADIDSGQLLPVTPSCTTSIMVTPNLTPVATEIEEEHNESLSLNISPVRASFTQVVHTPLDQEIPVKEEEKEEEEKEEEEHSLDLEKAYGDSLYPVVILLRQFEGPVDINVRRLVPGVLPKGRGHAAKMQLLTPYKLSKPNVSSLSIVNKVEKKDSDLRSQLIISQTKGCSKSNRLCIDCGLIGHIVYGVNCFADKTQKDSTLVILALGQGVGIGYNEEEKNDTVVTANVTSVLEIRFETPSAARYFAAVLSFVCSSIKGRLDIHRNCVRFRPVGAVLWTWLSTLSHDAGFI